VVKFDFSHSKPRKQPFFAENFKLQGWPRGVDWGDRPLKPYESNFIHYLFLQFGKQDSWFKSICRTFFCHSSVVKYTSTLLQQRSSY